VWVDLLLYQNKVQEASTFVDKNFTGAVDVTVLPKITRYVPKTHTNIDTVRILKRLGKDDRLVALCKQAWTTNQNTKGAQAYGQELFSAYVKLGNLNLQKQVS
jgi:hypothetical protein